MTSNWKNNVMTRLELLGIGSAKNRAFKANLEEALRQLGWDIPIEEISDIDRLLKYDISGIPALVVDGKVVFQRVVPSVEDIKIVLQVLMQPRRTNQSLKWITVPIDFSETAENALCYAIDLADRFGANVRVVHVEQPPADFGNALRFEAAGDSRLYKERLMKSLCDRYLRSRRDENGIPRVTVTSELVTGSIVDEIVRYSQDESTDLIVMGTTGEGGLFGRWFGSISTLVARRSACPVLLIPDGIRFKNYNRIVYASGQEPSEERVLQDIIDFAQPFTPAIYFVHIQEKKQHGANPEPDPQQGRIFRSNGLTFHLTTIESKDVTEGLAQFAEESRADLMVMSTTHRSFVEELFRKSTTRRMIFNTRIPLMILHF